jgi:hypothetical protein
MNTKPLLSRSKELAGGRVENQISLEAVHKQRRMTLDGHMSALSSAACHILILHLVVSPGLPRNQNILIM